MTWKFSFKPRKILWRIRLVSLLMLLLLGGNFQTKGQAVYAQGTACADRPENERSTPPATVWVEVETNYSEWGETRPVAKEVTFDFYISGVLLGELGPNVGSVTNANLPSKNGAWEDATLEALAVVIRSFTWFRFNYAGQFAEPHFITLDSVDECGFSDTGAQTFRPYYSDVSQEVKDHYTSVVTEHVPGIYLVEGEGTEPIDAEYRATVGEYSDADTSKNYLVSIYDPISANDGDPPYDALGLGQWGAQRLAMGLNDNGDEFPHWESYRQILFHYFSTAHLRKVDGDILTPDYRWNPLTVDWGGGEVYPPALHPGHTYDVSLRLQNTGVVEWDSDIKLVYYWLRNNGNRVTNSTQVEVGNLAEGEDSLVNLAVQVPDNFEDKEIVTLVIDLRRDGDHSGRYFHNRETGHPWLALSYPVCVGGECQTFLPVVFEDYTPPPPPCYPNYALIDNGGFEDGYPPDPWIEYSKLGYQLVFEGSDAHRGKWHAFLAGEHDSDDRLYQDFVLPTGSTGATLRFYFRLATFGNNPPAHHFFYARLKTTSGQTIASLYRFDNTAQQDIWYRTTVNVTGLSSWAGQRLRLSFDAVTDDSSLSSFHLDDVDFTVNCDLSNGIDKNISTTSSTIVAEPASHPATVEKPAELKVKQ